MEGEQSYSSTLSLNTALHRVGGQCHVWPVLTLGTRPGNHCSGGCVENRVFVDEWGKYSPQKDSITGPLGL